VGNETVLSDEEKRDLLLAEPRFGLCSMTKYFLRSPNTNKFYLCMPLLIFFGQWIMFVAVVSHNLRVPASLCLGQSVAEVKMLFIGVCLVYVSQSFQLLDELWRRGSKRLKTIPEASYTVMLDRIHERMFVLVVQVTNLFIVYSQDNIIEALFNCLAMEFLHALDNDFQEKYYADRLEEAVSVYDTVFVSHRENVQKLIKRRKHCCFRCVHAVSRCVFALTFGGYILMPIFAASMLVVGVLCK